MALLTKQKQMVGLAAWLIVSFIAAAIGSAASIQAAPFYTQLLRPDWAPPPGIFGPVWTVLYVLMGIAAWLVWRVGGFRAAKSSRRFSIVARSWVMTGSMHWNWPSSMSPAANCASVDRLRWGYVRR